MKKQNSSLAMVGLVLRVYHQQKRSEVLMRCALDPKYTDLPLDADTICTLLQDAGLACMSIRVRAGELPESLQDFANDRHLVMAGLKPSPRTPGQSWGVLEAGRKDDVGLVVFGNSPDPIHANDSLANVLTGEYVIVGAQMDKDDFGSIRGAMNG
jgi:hypothetical protein